MNYSEIPFDAFASQLGRLTKAEIRDSVDKALQGEGKPVLSQSNQSKDDLISEAYTALTGKVPAESEPQGASTSAPVTDSSPAVETLPVEAETPRAAGDPDWVVCQAARKTGRWRGRDGDKGPIFFPGTPTQFDRSKWTEKQRELIEADPMIKIKTGKLK